MGKIIRSAFTLIFGLLVYSSTALANPLELTVGHGAEANEVSVTLTNTGKQPLSILRWDTPFEKTLSHSVFQISLSEKALPFTNQAPYIGRHVKRRSPLGDSYFVLKAGESKTATVNLARYYQIDSATIHSVRFNGHINYTPMGVENITAKTSVNTVESLKTQEFFSKPVALHLSPLTNSTATELQKAADFNSCSAEQQTYIQSATDAAELLASSALSDLQSLSIDERPSSPRYTTWFGSYTAQRFDRVEQNFSAISNALTNETLRFDCTCDESFFAYVYPSQPYTIYLCDAFHAAAETGTDSRAGTIIHELSHFNILAGTDDHVYSQIGAQNLANTNPDLAIDNADSHEYFAENTPAIAIRSDGTSAPPTTDITTLEPGTVFSGAVGRDEVVVFQSTNVGRVTLTSLTGDADLSVYSDALLSNTLCQSYETPPDTDSCDIFITNTIYIVVNGYTEATFEIEATAQTTGSFTTFTALEIDTVTGGYVEDGYSQLYQVANASLLSLESITGNADLFVFSSSELAESNLVCSSTNSNSVEDSCELPSEYDTLYIAVVGSENSDYEIVATQATTTTTQTIVEFGSIELNTLISQTVNEGQIHIYQVTLDSSTTAVIELVSLTGDADLQLFESSPLDGATAICISEEYSSDSTLDSCDVSGISTLYISVFGYSASDYTLEAIQSVSTSGSQASGSGGGGSFGPLGLVIGMLLLTVYRSRRRFI